MTQATRFPAKRGLKNVNSKSNPSVMFETNTRYLRRSDTVPTPSPNTVRAVKRLEYIAPDAVVIIAPSAIERAAVDELLKQDSAKDKKRTKLTRFIKGAVHKESEIFDEYGVETKDIFTEEINLDFGIGATVAMRESNAANIFKSKENTGSFKVIKEELESKFREFAGKVYRLRIG